MDELLEILEDIDPDNDYENDEHLIDVKKPLSFTFSFKGI